MNTNLKIRDIAIVAKSHDGGAPTGEAPRSGEGSSRMSENERIEMQDRLFSGVNELIEQAKSDHAVNNKENDPNYITRLSTNEFFFYTKEPLTVTEFENVQNKIAQQLEQVPPGMQLILGSFAVQTEDNKVMNVTPHVSSGDPPAFNFIVKNYTSTIDVRYKGSDGRVLDVLDRRSPLSEFPNIAIKGHSVPFTFNNVVQCNTAGNKSFLTLIDICLDHPLGVAKTNYDALVSDDPAILAQPVSHVVVSNTVYLDSDKSIGTVMHIDPQLSVRGCKWGVEQTATELQQIFGKDTAVKLGVTPTVCLSLSEKKLYDDKINLTLDAILEKYPSGNPELLAEEISKHNIDDTNELIKKMPTNIINQTFINTLRNTYTSKTLPAKIIETILVQQKMMLLSDAEIINNINVNGPILPSVAVEAFPENIEIIKKACKEGPYYIVDPMVKEFVSPDLIKENISKEGPITPAMAVKIFPDNKGIIQAACEKDPDFITSRSAKLHIKPALIETLILKEGPITPAMAVEAFPYNEGIIRAACKADPDFITSESAKSHITLISINSFMLKEKLISPKIAIEQYNARETAFILGIPSVRLTSSDDDKRVGAILTACSFLPSTPNIKIKEFPNNPEKLKTLLDLYDQFEKLDKESSPKHIDKKEVIKAAMASLVTGDDQYLKAVLGSNNELNKQFDDKLFGISKTETLAIRTLKHINATTTHQESCLDKFKEIKGNFKKLIAGTTPSPSSAPSSAPSPAASTALSSAPPPPPPPPLMKPPADSKEHPSSSSGQKNTWG